MGDASFESVRQVGGYCHYDMVTHAALPAQQIKTVELKYKLLHIPAMEPAQATMG